MKSVYLKRHLFKTLSSGLVFWLSCFLGVFFFFGLMTLPERHKDENRTKQETI